MSTSEWDSFKLLCMKTTIPLCFALLFLAVADPRLKAVIPAPDGGYPVGNTAEGQNALLSRTIGNYNTAVGFFSLKALTFAEFNTAVGAGTLFSIMHIRIPLLEPQRFLTMLLATPTRPAEH